MNVLIAEDHAITAKLFSRVLSQAKDINVVGVASDGNEVLSMVNQKEVDVILLDINMPYLDGMEVMDYLFKRHSHAKILVLSGHTEAWIIEKSLKLGAAGYLTKKVDMNEVIEAITVVYNGDKYLDDISLHTIFSS